MKSFRRAASAADVKHIATRLRPADFMEVQSASGRAPRDALVDAWLLGPAMVAGVEGEDPCILYGVAPCPVHSFVGIPWMVATVDLERHSKIFLRECRAGVDWMHAQGPYSLLTNHVDARNQVHHKWLRWCGFQFIRLNPHYGAERRPFYEFVRFKDV